MLKELVDTFKMNSHPEGGWYKETYRSPINVSFVKDGTTYERSASTAILFLISSSSVSRLHRLKSDELWHFHSGDALTVVEMDEDTREVKKTRVGPNITNGEVFQYAVPAGKWFGSYSDGDWSLVGCTVSPGFDFCDFELARKDIMHNIFANVPEANELIEKLC